MINLRDTSSLSVTFDNRDNAIFFPEHISSSRIERVKLEELKPILLNRTLVYPDKVYTEYHDVSSNDDQQVYEKFGIHYNMVVLPTGLLGVEFTKSHIYAADSQSKNVTCVVEVIKGGATVLMQKIKPKEDYEIETTVEDIIIVKVKTGEKLPIPSGYQYSFINTRNHPLILSRVYLTDGRIDYRTIRREQGLSYYVIRKNARQEYVKNPRYRETPKLRSIKCDTYNRKYKISPVKPLYLQIIEDMKKFRDLLS